jgi:cytochrome c-type biogenesis protein CcmH/NrfG
MGWFVILIMALLLFVGLWHFAKLEKGPLQFLLAALLLAFAGYAWQGSPSIEGAPRKMEVAEKQPDSAFMSLRREMFGQFDTADRWLIMAENYRRGGKTQEAAAMIRSALRAHPRNATLWIGYGDALAAHGSNILSPAAELAFRRAATLAPRHPGPPLFYGIALAQSGDFPRAEREWRRALALAPANASWRPELERQLAMVDKARAAGQIR